RPLISEGLCLALSAVGENWWTEDCFSSRPYICKLPAVKRTTNPPKATCPPARLACPSGWTYFNVTNQCYKTFHNAYVTWNNADEACKGVKANLVSIHNYEEHLFVQDISATGVPMQWTTGHFDAGVWIGLTDAAELGTFRWSDGTPLDYEHWATARPQSIGYSCGQIFPDYLIGYTPDPFYNHWDNQACNLDMRGFVCKKLANK
ncbi:CLEC-50 protein, partial [Aphelenchoides avenae]